MSHYENFSSKFSEGKNHAVIKDISEAIARSFNLDVSRCNSGRHLDSWTRHDPAPSYSIEYDGGDSEETLIGKRLFNALFEKNSSIGLMKADERRELSFVNWLKTEEKCRMTNQKFRAIASGSFPERQTLLFLVSRKIANILGICPSLNDLNFGFGPGASVGVSRLTSVRRKLSARPTVTANAAAYVSILQASHPFWSLEKTEIRKGRLTFVPKSAVIDRAIVVEPIINTYVQKGIGAYIRSRLMHYGVNLDDQQTNRDFARFGSLTGLVATIDLSSASDLISKEVVAELLPYDWFRLLSEFRTPSVEYGDKVITLSKFSSMGNGFTFELESLIFFAICSVVCENSKFVNVFGDDIIVPVNRYEDVVDALEFFGFEVNLKKSFSTGKFRESCGKDFWNGVDIRPCYVKERLSYKELFRYHNFCKRNGYDCLASTVLRHIPRQLTRLTGPDGFGDGHLIGDWTPIYRNRKDGWGLLGFRTLATKPRVIRDWTKGDYAAFLYGTTGTHVRDNVFSQSQKGTAQADSLSQDPPLISRSMYMEPGGQRYQLRKVYTWTR